MKSERIWEKDKKEVKLKFLYSIFFQFLYGRVELLGHFWWENKEWFVFVKDLLFSIIITELLPV